MLQETIQAIKEAEAKAQEIIQHAWEEADEVKKASALRVREIEESSVKEARALLSRAREKAASEGEIALKEAQARAEKEAEALKALAAPGMNQAVTGVIEALFQ